MTVNFSHRMNLFNKFEFNRFIAEYYFLNSLKTLSIVRGDLTWTERF